ESLKASDLGSGPHSRWGTIGVPLEKSKNFGASIRRLARMLSHQWPLLIVVVVTAVSSAVLNVLGPRVLGRATDVIFRGVIGRGGIDFGRLHHVLFEAVALYVASWPLSVTASFLIAGLVQNTMF